MQTPDVQNRPDVKTSKLAVTSCILGVFSLFAFPIILFAASLPSPFNIVCFIPIILATLAVILGISGLASIAANRGRLTGRGFAAIGIAIPLFIFGLIGFQSPFAYVRQTRYRMLCENNLQSIGTSMLIYLNDWEQGFPRAGGPSSKWGTTPNWQADNRTDAYGLADGADGQASISASLFTMFRSYSIGGISSFVCPADSGTTQFNPAQYGAWGGWIGIFWDFGPDPSKHVSYSYHMPYGPYPLTKSHNPAMPLMADRNPWLDAPGYSARPTRDFVSFDPNGPKRLIRRGNAIPHQGNGQNVLFMDGHVSFEKTPICGVNGDNIYTFWNDKDISRGTRPVLGSQPASRTDSLLVHDPPLTSAK